MYVNQEPRIMTLPSAEEEWVRELGVTSSSLTNRATAIQATRTALERTESGRIITSTPTASQCNNVEPSSQPPMRKKIMAPPLPDSVPSTRRRAVEPGEVSHEAMAAMQKRLDEQQYMLQVQGEIIKSLLENLGITAASLSTYDEGPDALTEHVRVLEEQVHWRVDPSAASSDFDAQNAPNGVDDGSSPNVNGSEVAQSVKADLPMAPAALERRVSMKRAGTMLSNVRRQLRERLAGKTERDAESTGSLHIYAVVLACDSSVSGVRATFVALASLLLVSVQIAILVWASLDSSYPTCSSHGECNLGQFCQSELDNNPNGRPRCEDCNNAVSNRYPTIEAARAFAIASCANLGDALTNTSAMETAESGGSDDPAGRSTGRIRAKRGSDHITGWISDPTLLADLRSVPSEQRNQSILYTIQDCSALEYCATVDRWPDRCDYLHLAVLNLEPSFLLLIAFVALLLAKPLLEDMSQAATEDALLELRLASGAPRRLATVIMRLSLGLRRLFLPWCVSSSALGVVISASLTAANILLNLLAVSFITEADDVLSSLILPPAALKRVEQVMDGVKADSEWFEVRVVACICSITLVVATYTIEDCLNFVYMMYDSNGPCGTIQNVLQFFSGVLPFVSTIVIHVRWYDLCEKQGSASTLFRRVFRGLSSCAFGALVICVTYVAIGLGGGLGDLAVVAFGFSFVLFTGLSLVADACQAAAVRAAKAEQNAVAIEWL